MQGKSINAKVANRARAITGTRALLKTLRTRAEGLTTNEARACYGLKPGSAQTVRGAIEIAGRTSWRFGGNMSKALRAPGDTDNGRWQPGEDIDQEIAALGVWIQLIGEHRETPLQTDNATHDTKDPVIVLGAIETRSARPPIRTTAGELRANLDDRTWLRAQHTKSWGGRAIHHIHARAVEGSNIEILDACRARGSLIEGGLPEPYSYQDMPELADDEPLWIELSASRIVERRVQLGDPTEQLFRAQLETECGYASGWKAVSPLEEITSVKQVSLVACQDMEDSRRICRPPPGLETGDRIETLLDGECVLGTQKSLFKRSRQRTSGNVTGLPGSSGVTDTTPERAKERDGPEQILIEEIWPGAVRALAGTDLTARFTPNRTIAESLIREPNGRCRLGFSIVAKDESARFVLDSSETGVSVDVGSDGYSLHWWTSIGLPESFPWKAMEMILKDPGLMTSPASLSWNMFSREYVLRCTMMTGTTRGPDAADRDSGLASFAEEANRELYMIVEYQVRIRQFMERFSQDRRSAEAFNDLWRGLRNGYGAGCIPG